MGNGDKFLRGAGINVPLDDYVESDTERIRKEYVAHIFSANSTNGEENHPLSWRYQLLWLLVIRSFNYKPIENRATLARFMDSKEFAAIWEEYTQRRKISRSHKWEEDGITLASFKKLLKESAKDEEKEVSAPEPSITPEYVKTLLQEVLEEVVKADINAFYQENWENLSAKEVQVLLHFSMNREY